MGRRIAVIFGGLMLAIQTGCADVAPKAATPEPPLVRTAECRWANGPIQIDGRVDEAAWDAAEELSGFSIFWERKSGQTHTAARLLWDEQFLYFTAEMEDYDLYGDVSDRNGPTSENDAFGLYLKPATGKNGYFEFQVTPANTVRELYLPSRGAGGARRFASPKLGLESAVRRRGTLNKVDDKDGGWTVEGRIPWSAFQPTGGKPAPGAKWKFALTRHDYSWALEQPELTATAPFTKPDPHRYEEYGDLTFTRKK